MQEKMGRKYEERHETNELEAVLGEPKYHWREWEVKEESQSSPSRELSFNVGVPEEVSSFGSFFNHPFASSATKTLMI